MTTPAPQPSAYAADRLAELTAAGYVTEVLAATVEGTLLVLLDDEIPLFIAYAEDTPRAEIGRQVFVVCACAEHSFQRVLRSHVDEGFRLVWMH